MVGGLAYPHQSCATLEEGGRKGGGLHCKSGSALGGECVVRERRNLEVANGGNFGKLELCTNLLNIMC